MKGRARQRRQAAHFGRELYGLMYFLNLGFVVDEVLQVGQVSLGADLTEPVATRLFPSAVNLEFTAELIEVDHELIRDLAAAVFDDTPTDATD